ncbi:MAG: hypothetical protein EHM89_14395 [Acidobacteria bacterium]|nr:MAG: hypothetical protein EHM89_14395 [Acidobacteriota bacterium]
MNPAVFANLVAFLGSVVPVVAQPGTVYDDAKVAIAAAGRPGAPVQVAAPSQPARDVKETVREANRLLQAFLGGLCSADAPQLCLTTAGLRAWILSQTPTTDMDGLRALLERGFGEGGTYGPRYRLLIAGLAERRPELRDLAFAARERVIAALLTATDIQDVPTNRQLGCDRTSLSITTGPSNGSAMRFPFRTSRYARSAEPA